MKPVHLVMVTDKNNNKYYNMIPNGDTFTIEYGRIDATKTVLSKPMSQWDKIYNSKIKKGYIDKSDLIVEVAEESGDYAPISDRVIANLIRKLQDFANKTIESNYKITDKQVTQTMIDEAQSILDELSKKKDVESFNASLLELFATIPRKMKKVQDYLAKSTKDFAKIMSKEIDLLDVMAAKVNTNATKAIAVKNNQTILESLGLTIKNKDNVLEEKVKDMLGEISDKYVNCWYVNNDFTQKRYDEHIANQTGIHKDEKLFWHGSRNENWMSILQNGLMYRPSGAIVTGAMFNDPKEVSLYFANKARKSFGYTSAGYWTKGNAKTVYMAIFKVNTGKYHNVYKHTPECYTFGKKMLKKKGNYDSVYAHKGADLRNDEFIVYDLAQATIYALVELKG